MRHSLTARPEFKTLSAFRKVFYPILKARWGKLRATDPTPAAPGNESMGEVEHNLETLKAYITQFIQNFVVFKVVPLVFS